MQPKARHLSAGTAVAVFASFMPLPGSIRAQAQEPTNRELSRTEYGSLWSDGSSTIIGDSATFTPDSGSLVLEVDSGRPVYRAVESLQTRYGYVVTYEDPQYTYEDDLEDVAPRVARNYSRYPAGSAPKVIVPKGGHLALHIPASAKLSSSDLAGVLQQLADAQAGSPRGGHFRVEQEGDTFHVIPIEVRDRSGNWARRDSLLELPISLPVQDRSEEELYRAITSAVAVAAHVRLGVTVNGGIVMRVGASTPPELHTSIGAAQEAARSVLMRAVRIHPTRRTWAILCSPEGGQSVCVLSIRDVPPNARSTPVSQPSTPLPLPAPTVVPK